LYKGSLRSLDRCAVRAAGAWRTAPLRDWLLTAPARGVLGQRRTPGAVAGWHCVGGRWPVGWGWPVGGAGAGVPVGLVQASVKKP